jgi:ATP-dependent Clp protease ATP-binding subunit ClpB
MFLHPNYLNVTPNCKEVFHIAQMYAKENRNAKVDVSHILLALMHNSAGLRGFLATISVDVSYIMEWAEIRIVECEKSALNTPEALPLDANIQIVLEQADYLRLKFGLDLIDNMCLLAAVVKPNYGYSAQHLKSLPLREVDILNALQKLGGNAQPIQQDESVSAALGDSSQNTQATGALLTYCKSKNERALAGKMDPVVGRDKELMMMIEVLGRRSKPNVLLLGEPGVGKSALVDGFVQKIIAGEVPSLLKNAIVFELDLGTLQAGASYKGEVEDRIKKIISDLKLYDKAILFIDELHALMDGKGSFGSGVANLLKPELARGEITVIGATTQAEYRKIIEPDAAFNRRFETITVQEPDVFTASKMIERILPKYEAHHDLKVQFPAIKGAVLLAKRYVKEKSLPDSAIDLLDRTLAAVKMMNETSVSEITSIESELALLESNAALTEEERLSELKWLHIVLFNKLSPVLLGSIEDTLDVSKMDRVNHVRIELKKSIAKLHAQLGTIKNEVSLHDVAAIIAHKTGIPVGKIQTQERDKLLSIESHLQKRVIGQDHAIKILSDTVIESRSGIQKQGQPIGSFFFLGPTGTGKTELTKAIAEFLFNDEKAMIRFDMSEFKEEHSAALLYGAPPGYVGYEEGGMLVNKIRQKPYSVVLFDEIEKAHHSVFDTFLQIMDEGTLHDKLGKEGDFSNSIIIFTSNIASEWVVDQFQKGIRPTSQALMDVMAKNFRPEFLARLSEIIPFAPIAEENVVRIFDIQLKSLYESLAKQEIELVLSDAAKNNLAMSGFTPKYGARQLVTVIRSRLRRPISKMLISGELKKGERLFIDLKADDELVFNVEEIVPSTLVDAE